MNCTPVRLVAFLLLLCLPYRQWAQQVWLQTYENTPLIYQFQSKPNHPNWNRQPVNGTAAWINLANYNRELTYVPNPDFVGFDTIRIVRWVQNPATQWTLLTLFIEVQQANVKAYHDYATTTAGQPVTVNVLDNDFSSNGVKNLAVIPIVNNGAAASSASNGTITFTPAPGFSGLTHLGYVVCNNLGDCDEGTLSITVVGNAQPAEDTVRVFTRKNEPQFILSPTEYTLLTPPQHGSYDPASDVPTYTPQDGYVGMDYMSFDNGSGVTVFAIEVLNLRDNEYAFNDRAYTVANQSVEFNVLSNDLATNCFSYNQPAHGSVAPAYNGAPQGLLEYTPAPGFIGVDEFTYQIYGPGCQGEPETATAYVFVNNFEPDRSTFHISTPKMTPIIIGYNIPVGTFNFSVAQQGGLGTALFLQGSVDTVIYGASIVGDDLLIYVPNADVEEGQDEIEIVYCLMDPQGGCAVSKTVKIFLDILNIGSGGQAICVGTCVWAGDTNFDGLVNMEDLLPIGQAMGRIGRPRSDANLDYWYGQYADDWSDLFANVDNTVDLKHIDVDGSSIVTAVDTIGINLFYGRAHAMVPRVLPYAPYEISLDGDIFVEPGELVTLTFSIGSSGSPAHNMYGFVFPFLYNPEFFEPESVNASFQSSNWLAYNSPVLHMKRNNGLGLLEMAYTRTNGIAASGHGQIGTVSFVVVDDLAGTRPDEKELELTVGGGTGLASNMDGSMSQVVIKPFTLKLRLQPETEGEVLAADLLRVYPNPATDMLTLRLKGEEQMQAIAIYSLTGQRVSHVSNIATRQAELNVANLPAGMYVVSVTTGSGVINRKVEIFGR